MIGFFLFIFNLNSFTEEAGREHCDKTFPCTPESPALSLKGFVGELAGSPSDRGGHGEEQVGVMAVAALLIEGKHWKYPHTPSAG